ncbi:hypothetical protein DWW99_05470 [[Clostridium] leptum]|nr:hypothetical protein DWW99_05470 [[Clostridium] leptum]
MKKSIFYSENLLCPGSPEKLPEEFACALAGACCTDQRGALGNGAAPAESAGPGEIIRFILPQKSSRLLGDGPRLCGIRIPVEAWLFRILILGKSKEKEQEVVTNAG